MTNPCPHVPFYYKCVYTKEVSTDPDVRRWPIRACFIVMVWAFISIQDMTGPNFGRLLKVMSLFLERAVGRNSPYSFIRAVQGENQWHHSVTIHLPLEHDNVQSKSTVWIVTVLCSSHAHKLQLVALSQAWKIQEMEPSVRKLDYWGHVLEGDVGAPSFSSWPLWGEHVSPCIVLSCHDLLRLSKDLTSRHKVFGPRLPIPQAQVNIASFQVVYLRYFVKVMESCQAKFPDKPGSTH